MKEKNSELKSAGLKTTAPRIKVLELLESRSEGERHLSAEEAYKLLLEAGEDVGLATIYRVLTQFEAAGLVARHYFEAGHAVYELLKEEHHDHMICTDTGRIIEFTDPVIEARQHEIAKQHGYVLVDHSLVMYVKKI